MGLLEKLQARTPPALVTGKLQADPFCLCTGLELYRLEQRYTRRDRRTTFTTAAQYVDGEYVYASSPASPTKSSTISTTTTDSRRSSQMPSPRIQQVARFGSSR